MDSLVINFWSNSSVAPIMLIIISGLGLAAALLLTGLVKKTNSKCAITLGQNLAVDRFLIFLC